MEKEKEGKQEKRNKTTAANHNERTLGATVEMPTTVSQGFATVGSGVLNSVPFLPVSEQHVLQADGYFIALPLGTSRSLAEESDFLCL